MHSLFLPFIHPPIPSHFSLAPVALQHARVQVSYFFWLVLPLTAPRPKPREVRVLCIEAMQEAGHVISCPGWAGQVCGGTCNSWARSVGSTPAPPAFHPFVSHNDIDDRGYCPRPVLASKLPSFLPLGLILGCAFRFTPWLSGATHRRSPIPHVK